MRTGESVRVLPDNAQISVTNLWLVRAIFAVLGLLPLIGVLGVVLAPSGASFGYALGTTGAWYFLYRATMRFVATEQ